jgi:hypothetical protein
MPPSGGRACAPYLVGAERVDWDSYTHDPDFLVLVDPEGNRFCIVALSHEHS